MQSALDAGELMRWIEKLNVIKTCKHQAEVEAQYDDHVGQKFQMCRDCWNEEKHYEISKDTVQVIRPNQLSVVIAKCLKCGSGMDSCGCGAT